MNERRLVIDTIIERAYNVKSCRIGISGEPGFTAGQFMCVSLDAERSCKRYLSFSSSPTEKGYIEFTKRITQSDFSRYLERSRPGDMLYVRYPMGKFVLPEKPAQIAFLCGGIGITPVRSMCKYVSDSASGHDITVLCGNRSQRDIVFEDDFRQMRKNYAALRFTQVLSDPEPGFRGPTGLINAGLIRQEIPDFSGRLFYLCGPPSMVASLRDVLDRELALAGSQIMTENFTGYE